jgi:hypothetical protein
MGEQVRSINFGEIDHFLYVRIHCVCADLGLTTKEFIEQAREHVRELIDQRGITHFHLLKNKYDELESYRRHTRYAPRMTDLKHAFVVGGISRDAYDHLVVMRKENGFPWIILLQMLLMMMEFVIDREDKRVHDMEEWLDEMREEAEDTRIDKREIRDGYMFRPSKAKEYKDPR